jgi:hypothetical protein
MAISGAARVRRAASLAVMAIALGSGAAQAQSLEEGERIRELERKLEQSMKLIEQLAKRVNELERGAAPRPAPVPAVPPAQEARIEAIEKSIAQMGTGQESRAERGVAIHGFTDAGYEHSTMPRADTRRAGFALGNLDFFITPNFGRVKLLAELNFEVDEGGGLATDLERLQIGYTFSDAFTLWLGRYHTPYGYWNTAFHHGAQIQTAVTRPRFIDFEDKGGILPSHSVGLWANGHLKAGSGRWVYDAYMGNGSRVAGGVLDFNAHRDDNANKALGANLGYVLGAGPLEGLLVGTHALREEVATYDEAGSALARTRLAFTGAYYYFDNGAWESTAEYYRFRNKDLTGGSGTHASWAAFWQLGRAVSELWMPYYRWEKALLAPGDAYFVSQESGRSYLRHVLGVRYNFNPNTAVKLEANRTREVLGEQRWYSELRAQFAVRF